MKSFFIFVFWFFSLISFGGEESQYINQILKVSDDYSSIQKNNYSFLFAIKSEVSFTNVSLNPGRRISNVLNFQFYIQKFKLYNFKLILFNYTNKNSIIYLTKQLIGIPIYLCKLTI